MVKSSEKVSVQPKKLKKSNIASQSSIKGSEKCVTNAELLRPNEKYFSEVTISIESYHNIRVIHPSSLLFARCSYLENDLGRTEPVIMTDDPIVLCNHEFKFKCNPDSHGELQQFSANPVLIKLFQTPNLECISFVLSAESSKTDNTRKEEIVEAAVDSALTLYESFTGDVLEKPESTIEKSSEKLKSKDKLMRTSSKESAKLKKKFKQDNNKESITKINDTKTEIEIGTCIVDLLPLLLGKQSFSEFVPLAAPQIYFDDRMIKYNCLEGIGVTVSIDKPIDFDCKPNILSVTLESIFNPSSDMKEDMEYTACVLLPSVNIAKTPYLFQNGTYTTKSVDAELFKLWPGIPKNYYNKTQYKIDPRSASVKDAVGNIDFKTVFGEDKPRIQFDTLQRNILTRDGFYAMYDYIKKFRNVILEIRALKQQETEDAGIKTKNSNTSCLHLMAIVDLSSLLYPGVTKLRIATSLKTFHEQEALLRGGLEKSYFFPSMPKIQSKTELSRENSASKQDIKTPKKSPKTPDKSSKGSTKTKNTKKSSKKLHNKKVEDNTKKPLPVESKPESESGIQIFNAKQEPTFIILEIEITQSLVEKPAVEDLHFQLKKLRQQTIQTTPKFVFSKQLMAGYCHSSFKKIVLEINNSYAAYMDKKAMCRCEKHSDFLTYLRRTGSYQNFLCSITQIVSFIAQNKLNLISEYQKPEQFQTFAENLFVDLIGEVNQALHKMTITSRVDVKFPSSSSDYLLFYAKEAAETGNPNLAERYYLERLYCDVDNADWWFDYAVYNVQCGNLERAFLCLQEALSKKLYHRNSLLLSGIILADTNRPEDAELCFLNAMVQEPLWVEGWMVLYLFYKDTENTGGMDLSLEMAHKYFDSPETSMDNFLKIEDLAWTQSICPNTIFFRAAIILLKMRMFQWAENALAFELQEKGTVHYLLAVICYYKKNYNHALAHLEKAKYFHCSDRAVLSLIGHCLLALGSLEEAHQEYLRVLNSFETDHLVYLNCAKTTKNTQEARKLILIACKHNPTPYSWMLCGIFYYKQNDLLSAEECFSESVALDNKIPESWGYLTLINLKLRRANEAEICYGFALKNNLKNEYLLNYITAEFKKLPHL